MDTPMSGESKDNGQKLCGYNSKQGQGGGKTATEDAPVTEGGTQTETESSWPHSAPGFQLSRRMIKFL